MTALLIILNVLAAVLPAWGLIRLLQRARSNHRAVLHLVEQRGYSYYSYDDFNATKPKDIRAPSKAEVRDLWIDTALVGGGLALGAVANIWSLLQP